ncbi:hypothetical protein V6N13_128296 [Hibiscus sabdariffa]
MTDALIAVERMNGINLYGFKLSVALAKYKGKSKVRVHEVQNENHVERNTGVATENVTISNRKLEKAKISWHQDLEQERGKSSNRREDVVKRVTGHVETEELWRMKMCLVGEMATVCSVKNIRSRLVEWGMGEIKFQRLGGKFFLLTFDDDELFMMLEDLQWSYLKEVFIDVVAYGGMSMSIVLQPLSLIVTCVVQIGKKVIVSEGHVIDCEKVTMLINTSQIRRIDEMVELEVGKFSYIIRVVEMGLSENSENSNVEVKLSKGGNGGNQPSESLSESSSEEVEKSSTFLDKGNDGVSNETVNAECFFNNCCEDNHVDVIWAHADVLFQKVGPFCENNDNLGQQGFGVKAESSWVEVISKKPAETNDKGVPLGSLPDPVGVAEKVPTKVVEDVSNLGILPLGDDVSQIKDLWVDEVDVFITSFSDPCPSRAQGDKDEPGNFFLELKTIRKSRKEKNSESEVGKRAMRILLWNVRGIGASVKVLAISKLIREQMMEMVLL